jgi:hypothetical protein
MGFMSVTGVYVTSLFRDCVENGGLFLLDELDAADPNVILSLNTIENGYVTFPTGIVKVHPEFRLMATSNPQDKHEMYTGRAKLDKATLDRFDIIELDRDEELEKSLVDFDTYNRITILRKIMLDKNISNVLSMRDSLRFQARKDLDLLDGFVYRLVNKSDLVYDSYNQQCVDIPKNGKQEDCVTFDDLVELVTVQSKNKGPYNPGFDSSSTYSEKSATAAESWETPTRPKI